ncbi:hypothetical protein D2910_16610 [Planomicrobium okeanokoites]|nr:hypothetical protein D2910_16610 [Planomicrobium okeanokoites]
MTRIGAVLSYDFGWLSYDFTFLSYVFRVLSYGLQFLSYERVSSTALIQEKSALEWNAVRQRTAQWAAMPPDLG